MHDASGTGISSASLGGIIRLGADFDGANRWRGRLSNARLFFNAVPPTDVTTLYKGTAAHPRNGCAALFAKYP
jgi:hypothetical protein